ncbi:inositol phosphorylceramide synthase [Halorubraceae archaeon YAN]|nr:inositol phosphorylceramide synthase [Halorubraceae archaeon YAN]
MLLFVLTGVITVVVLFLLCLLSVICLDRKAVAQLTNEPALIVSRLRSIAPYAGLLGIVLVANKGLQDVIYDLSMEIGFEATETIYAVEGLFVAFVQAGFPEGMNYYFSFMYVFGYVVLLVFPAIAYFVSDSLEHLKILLTAYGLNYAGGIVCYTLVVAYGPRNHIPEQVSQPLLDLYPDVTTVTSQVNRNTNVFPSLHTSLSVTVFAIALMTRETFPRWFTIATIMSTSIVLSTMALGIHWLVDVVAGIGLAAVSVALGTIIVERS